MRYYDNEFRAKLSEILKDHRKMLEQKMISSDDHTNQIVFRSKINEVDEVLKVVKPSMFDALQVRKIEKLQAEQFSQVKTEELKAQLRKEVEEELRKERAEKKKQKKAKKESDAMLAIQELIKNAQQNGQPAAISSGTQSVQKPETQTKGSDSGKQSDYSEDYWNKDPDTTG